MDPISQGVLGAIYPQALVKKKSQIVSATIIGFLSGMLPDIDTFIRIPGDDLSWVEYHRHFTHSLAFIPVGALLAAIMLYYFFKGKLSFKQIYFFSFLGYATHGLLDSCTSYGTQLLLPFSNYRVAWDVVSIIDPLYTLPLLVLMILTVKKSNLRYARIAVLYSLVYLSLGYIQNQRAHKLLKELASERGHVPAEITVKPTFANLIVWKLIYLYEGKYYLDAAHLFINQKVYEGEVSPKLDLKRDFSWLKENDVQYADVGRFSWFSAGYLSVHPNIPNVIGDMRYSLEPNKIQPIWGIRLSPDKFGKHVQYESFRSDVGTRMKSLWSMILGL